MAGKMFEAGSMGFLKRSLDAYSLRQRTIAENIANAETPGYKSRVVKFEELLQDAASRDMQGMGRAGGGRKSSPQSAFPRPEVSDEAGRASDNGVNNASGDQEMAALAETTLNYKMAARILALRFQGLRAAIKGRS